jgi:hypothetical protein
MPAIDLKVAVDQPAAEAQAQMLDKHRPCMSVVHLTGHSQSEAVTYRPKFPAWSGCG